MLVIDKNRFHISTIAGMHKRYTRALQPLSFEIFFPDYLTDTIEFGNKRERKLRKSLVGYHIVRKKLIFCEVCLKYPKLANKEGRF